MSRLGSAFWLSLALGSGFAMYMVKYGVQNLENQLTQVRKQTVVSELDMRVLDAEWSYLVQPARLATLNTQFVGLVPLAPKQLETTIAQIPLRPPPAPAEMVAAAPPAAAPASEPAAARQGGFLTVTPVALVTPAPARAPASPQTAAAPRADRSLDQLFAQVAGGH